jgi:hypothetical protein
MLPARPRCPPALPSHLPSHLPCPPMLSQLSLAMLRPTCPPMLAGLPPQVPPMQFRRGARSPTWPGCAGPLLGSPAPPSPGLDLPARQENAAVGRSAQQSAASPGGKCGGRCPKKHRRTAARAAGTAQTARAHSRAAQQAHRRISRHSAPSAALHRGPWNCRGACAASTTFWGVLTA